MDIYIIYATEMEYTVPVFQFGQAGYKCTRYVGIF